MPISGDAHTHIPATFGSRLALGKAQWVVERLVRARRIAAWIYSVLLHRCYGTAQLLLLGYFAVAPQFSVISRRVWPYVDPVYFKKVAEARTLT